MKNKPSNTMLDIVIPVYGRFDILQRCVAAIPDACASKGLAWGGVSYNIILVDDNSPDQKEATEFYSKAKDCIVVRNKENKGFPATCNAGFRRKSSPYVLFLNSDVILDPGSIYNAVRAMDDPKIGIVGFKLIFPDDVTDMGLNPQIRPSGRVQHVGLATSVSGQFYHLFIGWHEDNPRVQAVREVYAVTGAALLTRRSLFQKFGGFFEGYGNGTFEDVDYCLIVREAGLSVIVEQSARGLHYANASSESYKKAFPMQMNYFTFLSRHPQIIYTEVAHL